MTSTSLDEYDTSVCTLVHVRARAIAAAVSLVFAACGNFDSSASARTYTIGGTVSGLTSGASVTLAAASNFPGARSRAVVWTCAGGSLWLFGGIGYDSAGNPDDLNDLWKRFSSESAALTPPCA